MLRSWINRKIELEKIEKKRINNRKIEKYQFSFILRFYRANQYI